MIVACHLSLIFYLSLATAGAQALSSLLIALKRIDAFAALNPSQQQTPSLWEGLAVAMENAAPLVDSASLVKGSDSARQLVACTAITQNLGKHLTVAFICVVVHSMFRFPFSARQVYLILMTGINVLSCAVVLSDICMGIAVSTELDIAQTQARQQLTQQAAKDQTLFETVGQQNEVAHRAFQQIIAHLQCTYSVLLAVWVTVRDDVEIGSL